MDIANIGERSPDDVVHDASVVSFNFGFAAFRLQPSASPPHACDVRLRRCGHEIHEVTPVVSIVTNAAPFRRVSVRHAASRGRRDSLHGAVPAAPMPAGLVTSSAHECFIEVWSRGQRMLAHWSSALSLSIDCRAPSRSAADTGEMLVRLHGTMTVPGAEMDAVNFGSHLTARIDAGDAFARECVGRLFDLGRQSGDVCTLFADALLRTVALHVFTRYAAPASEPARYGDRLAAVLARDLQSFIDTRLDRRLSRTDLARLAGYGAREFSTAFRNTFGMTPMQYVIERRLDRACLLIATTERHLADIAISAGFSSQSHLTSTLKKRRGITPLRLRRQSSRVITAS